MTKADIVDQIAERTGLTKKDVAETVHCFLNAVTQAFLHIPRFLEWCAANGRHACPTGRPCVTCCIRLVGCRFVVADPDATLDPFLLRQAVASVAPPNFALKTRGDAIEVMECILEQIHQAGDENGHCTPCLTHEMFAYQYMRYQKCDSCGHEESPGRAEAYGWATARPKAVKRI